MITAVRIQNLRSLRDTGYIPIKPLTILLGANSTGKSTFLRSFLLFAQSVNKRLRGPISWFDDSLVDFGDFYTAINAEARENKEPMRFSFKIAKSERDRYPRNQFGFWYAANRASTITDYELSISLACVEGETYVNEVTFNEGELDVKATVSSRDAIVQFYVNGKPFKSS
jgi:ABC-type cobalamin/Fe3+-siderophores transport system ATPase subunit